MKKLNLLSLVTLLFVTAKISAQTSQAFKDAAYSATYAYNNQNYKCVEYAQKLQTFLKTNSEKYDVDSYEFYEIKTRDGKPFIVHDDYKGGRESISDNGRHIIAIIDGEVFDNHHPKGQSESTWKGKLSCAAGDYPSGFSIREITSIY